MEKLYLCRLWPELTIRKIRFHGGLYKTDNLDEQALIEANDAYGVHITEVPINTAPISERVMARQGGRGTTSLA